MRWFLAISSIAITGIAFAQPDRYELGRRMHDFEVAWDAKADDAAAKKRAVPLVNQAVQQFFRFNFPGAGKAIDEARHALASAEPALAAVRWADSLQIIPATRMVDAATPHLTVTVKPFYKSEIDAPKNSVVRIKIGNGKPAEAALDTFPATVKVSIKDAPGPASADFKLTAEILSDGKVLATKVASVSRVEKMAERVEAVKKAAKAVPVPPTTIEQATLALLGTMVDELAQGKSPETDYPGSRLVFGGERLAIVKEPYYIASRSGEFWLGIPTGKVPAVVRMRIPPKLDGKKTIPVLFALHGMGGSENLFFDGYGNGIVPRLASERGWLVVATRVGALGPPPDVITILDELSKRYPIDPKRVYLIGHSMGAGHVIQLAQQHPERFAAVAALGGGGRIAKPQALEKLQFFVGCGKLDFALTGAQALHKSLKDAKCQVTYKEYDDIEHLTIVREAALDVFRLFDATPTKN